MPEHSNSPAPWMAFLKGLLVFGLLLFPGTACRTNDVLFLVPEEVAWLTAHGDEIEVLIEEDLPPFVFRGEKGTYEGFFIDHLREVERLLGTRFKLREFSIWSNLLTHAYTHDRLIILGINRTDERARHLLFTTPVVKVPYAIVTQKSSIDDGTISDFSDKKLCTVKNYAVNDDLTRHYPNIVPMAVKNSLKGLHAVASGTCDAMVINQIEASYLIDHLGLTNLQITGQTQFLNRLALATSIHDPMLYGILEKAVNAIPPGRRHEIYRNWISSSRPELSSALVIAIEVGAGVVLSVIFLLWAWTSSLRKRVNHQTRQIQESNENLRITLNSIGDGVLATDTQNRVTQLNPVAVTLTGWSQKEASGVAISEVFQIQAIHPRRGTAPNLAEKMIEATAATHEAILISRGGDTCHIHYSVSPIRDGKKRTTGTVLVFRDITDKVKAEEELLQIRQLESIGILAGGIAHDFNNLLTGLYGNISMARMEMPDTHPAQNYLSLAEESMESAVALTSQFLTFSKDEKPTRRVLDIAHVLEEAATFTSHGLNTRLKTTIDDDLWPISGDKGQLSQVVGNLIINAHQSMSTGGLITLTAENQQEASGRYVRITVTDMGSGIEPEHLDKIFDPYFTTKKTGSGLGLATTYAIITKHNGTIKVKSKPMEGTTFTIDLPATIEPLAAQQKKKTKVLANTHTLKADILVLDDQAVIRKILDTILGKLGFDVTFTVEGRETVAAYKTRLAQKRPYDVVILDLTIPGGMGGREVSEKILTMDPAAKIIISSGYASDPIMSNYEEFGIKAIVAKPYRFSDFKEVIINVLINT